MEKEKEVICPVEFNKALIKRSVSFHVPGKPFGKQRPRVVTRGGFARAYTPKETVNYENLVKLSYIELKNNFKLEGPIKAEIEGIFPIPISTSKKQKEKMISGEIKYIKKPDCDNIAKSILDALNNIAYNDDSQICDLHIKKKYGENPGVNISLEEIK